MTQSVLFIISRRPYFRDPLTPPRRSRPTSRTRPFRLKRQTRTDRVRNEEVLHRVKEERNIVHTIKGRNANWIGHILRRNCLLKHVIYFGFPLLISFHRCSITWKKKKKKKKKQIIFMRSTRFWDITRRRVVIVYRRFGTTYWFHLSRVKSPSRKERKPATYNVDSIWESARGVAISRSDDSQ
jgi:hypothetical protein